MKLVKSNRVKLPIKNTDSEVRLYLGDCIDIMDSIADKSVDMILCDLPYGVTAKNKWDSLIPFDLLWKAYNRIIKDNGAIVLFGQDRFTAMCVCSNLKMHRYNLVWNKTLTSGFLNANRMPLRQHEDIMVFYKKLPTYNPQKIEGKPCHSKGKAVGKRNDSQLQNNNYGDFVVTAYEKGMKYPTSILQFAKPHSSVSVHPTQKPVDLLEYLIRTYTNPGEVVLDNCMGSGSTGVACIHAGRHFIGIEKEATYFKIAKDRIKNARSVGQ